MRLLRRVGLAAALTLFTVPGVYGVVTDTVLAHTTVRVPSPSRFTAPTQSGTYRIVGSHLASGRQDTAMVTVVNAGPNLVLEGAHVTQAIQTVAGTVPLVANRAALLRVFVTTPATNTLQPTVRVRLYDGVSLVRTITIAAPSTSVPTSINDGTLTNSWNATLLASDLRTTLRIQVDVDPTNTISEPDESDNIWPRSGTAVIDVRTVPPFNVVFVPVRQSVNNRTGNVTPANLESTFLSMTRHMFPLNEINASVRAVYTTNAPSLTSGDTNFAWLTILSEMGSLRIADGSSSHYYGIVNPDYGSGVAGYAHVPGRTAVGWDKAGSANRVTAHELGHNFSRRHVAACGSGNVDTNYPHAGGVIGHTGYNQGTGVLVTKTTTDIMGYCGTQWISDYTWNGALNYRGPGPMVAGFATSPQLTLMVWGRIQSGVVTLEPTFRLTTMPVVADAPGAYRLELRDTAGMVLTGFTFDPDTVDHADDAQTFAFAIPMDSAIDRHVASVAIVGPSTEPTIQSAPRVLANIVGANMSTVIKADDGRTDVTDPQPIIVSSDAIHRMTWDDARWPMAMVRDIQTGQVLSYLRASGNSFVTTQSSVRVVFSNGVKSVTRILTVDVR